MLLHSYIILTEYFRKPYTSRKRMITNMSTTLTAVTANTNTFTELELEDYNSCLKR